MTLAEWAFQMSYIPGSIYVTSMPAAQELLKLNDEIVVYCSDEQCLASRAAYIYLTSSG